MAEIPGNLINAQISFDGGTTYKNVLCQTDVSIDNTTPISVTQTNCGPKANPGTPAWTATVNLVLEKGINSSTEVSSNQLIAAQNAGSLIKFRVEEPLIGSAGIDYYRGGDAYISKCTDTFSATELVKTAVTLTGNDIIDITPP